MIKFHGWFILINAESNVSTAKAPFKAMISLARNLATPIDYTNVI